MWHSFGAISFVINAARQHSRAATGGGDSFWCQVRLAWLYNDAFYPGSRKRFTLDDHAVELTGVSKNYGSVQALADVSLTIRDREFFTLLGPSGCGKTTLLRIIAGFESVTAGSVSLFGNEIGNLPPFKRPVNTVFQQYSLFPHMSVRENVLFGLQMKGVDARQAAERADRMLSLVQLSGLEDRKPAQLSGGQQQRVALARALAPEPQVLLLDEPLSALDLKLRQSMRGELKRIQQEAGITFVFVTHDQEEALTMSDRIAVMSGGHLQQVDDSETIYQRPANRFVADFIGDTNFLDATLVSVETKSQNNPESNSARVALADGVELMCDAQPDISAGAKGAVCVRPEAITMQSLDKPVADIEGAAGANNQNIRIQGAITEKVFLGTDMQYTLRSSAGEELKARRQNAGHTSENFDVGESVAIYLNPAQVRFLVE